MLSFLQLAISDIKNITELFVYCAKSRILWDTVLSHAKCLTCVWLGRFCLRIASSSRRDMLYPVTHKRVLFCSLRSNSSLDILVSWVWKRTRRRNYFGQLYVWNGDFPTAFWYPALQSQANNNMYLITYIMTYLLFCQNGIPTCTIHKKNPKTNKGQ